MDGLEWISQAESLRVRQKVEWGEVFTGYQFRNKYVVDDGHERMVFHAGEVSNGFSGFATRAFLKNRRPFLIQIFGPERAIVLEVRRPWRFFFSEVEVRDGRGNVLGAVKQRWAWFARRYTLEDPYGKELAELHGPFFKPWTFELKIKGQTVGFLRKRWAGLAKEAFTQADQFTLQLGPSIDPTLRAIFLGATFLIDFNHFERSSR